MVFIRQNVLNQVVGLFFFFPSLCTQEFMMTGEKAVAMKSELFCLFRESLLRNLGQYVCIWTALAPVCGMSENSFTLHSIFPIISLTVCSIQTRPVLVYLILAMTHQASLLKCMNRFHVYKYLWHFIILNPGTKSEMTPVKCKCPRVFILRTSELVILAAKKGTVWNNSDKLNAKVVVSLH